MSTTTPGHELTASAVIAQLDAGAYPREVVVNLARGFLPLAQEEIIPVLTYLGTKLDPEVAELARHAMHDIPSRVIAGYASNESASPDELVRLMDVSNDAFVLEALIRNKSVPDQAVRQLARRGDARVQEVIVINHARILRVPELLDALLENPALTPDVRRRVHETREEFFIKKTRRAGEEEPDIIDVPLDAIEDLLERAAREDQEPAPAAPSLVLTESEKTDERASALWTRLNVMTVSEKVRLAYRGDRTIRMLLVRERNKLICSAVMRNPRMSEQEAEAIAGMRNVDDEVLRVLASRRDWTSKYKILLTLCRNPKAPIGVVLPFVNRLTLRDLKGLKDDKGVQQVIRETARKVYLLRAQKDG
jgi:hypothetical protein